MTPSETSDRMSFRVSRALFGSSPMVGSSRNRISGPMQDAPREVQLLLHSPGVLLRPSVGRLGQVHSLEDLANAALPLIHGDPVQVREVPEVLPPADPVVEATLASQHEPHPGPEPVGILRYVVAQDQRRPRGRQEEGRENLREGRLPRPVGTEQAKDRPTFHGQVDPLQGLRPGLLPEEESLSAFEGPGHSPGLDGGSGFHGGSPRRVARRADELQKGMNRPQRCRNAPSAGVSVVSL